MKITIFTDASVDLTNHNCGYAFYIGCQLGKLQKAGKLRIRTPDSVMAELHSIANAVYTLKHSKFKPVSKVWLYSDQKQCCMALRGDARGFRKIEHRKVIDEIHFLMMEICVDNGRSIRDIDKMFEINHIAAHTGNKDKLSLINDWCDENAKKYALKPKPIHTPTKRKKR